MPDPKEETATWVAVGLIIIFTVFNLVVIILLITTSMDEPQWGHYTYILSAAGAVTSIAVGWLFGRKEAQMAEKRASHAEVKEKMGIMLAGDVMAHVKLRQAMINSNASNTAKSPAEVALDAHMDELVERSMAILK
jgi:hypothetical protein